MVEDCLEYEFADCAGIDILVEVFMSIDDMVL